MIIDKEQLISLLKEKTGHEREKVEYQLAELIKRIRKAAEEDKSFEIEGFGTFSMEDDSLQFEPTNTLETEINNKYAGMKPIELIGAFKEPEGDEVPEIDEDRIDIIDEDRKDKAWIFDKETAEEETSEEPLAESGKELTDEEKAETDEGLVEQFEGGQEPLTSKKDADEIVNILSGMDDETSSSDLPKKEAAKTEDKPEKITAVSNSKKDKDTLGKVLVAAVIVIAVVLSGWVAYDTGLISGVNSTEDVQQAGQLSSQQNQVSGEEFSQEQSPPASEEDNNSEPEQELAVGKEEDPQPNSELEEEATFGLKGEVNKTVSNGYTIVVHSLRRMQVAEDRRNDLQESGYRALISEADVQGTTYYRVGLGQFQIVEDALQAVSNIPESYQSKQNHFIRRIQ